MSVGDIAKVVALVLAAVALLLLFRRAARKTRAHDASKLASVIARADEPFTLHHRVSGAAELAAYLRYEVDFEGGEDDFGLRCQFELTVDGAPTVARDLGISGAVRGPPAPLRSAEKVAEEVAKEVAEVSVQYDVSLRSGGKGYLRQARVELAVVPIGADGVEVLLRGTVTTNALTSARALEVYLVPRSARL